MEVAPHYTLLTLLIFTIKTALHCTLCSVLCKVYFFAQPNKPGVSILMSHGVNPHYVKLPIFSEFMENSAKFMKY